MAVVLATVLAAGIAILPDSVLDAHAGQCDDNSIAVASSMGVNGQGDGEQDDSGVAQLAVMKQALLIINEITVIESKK